MRTLTPPRLKPLEALSRNLWWSWHPPAIDLFRDLDPARFAALQGNPVALLQDLEPDRLGELENDSIFLEKLERIHLAFRAYLEDQDTWSARRQGTRTGEIRPVAYFSMEFGLHESLRIYSGGLGVLAGDHLRSASDLGLPFVGVGLLYREGYFQQVIQDQAQVARYPVTDFTRLPLTRLLRDEQPLTIPFPIGEFTGLAQVWALDVGRVRLWLLDADLPSNPPEIRALTHRLYGGDARTRLGQEILLGIGGVRLLETLGIDPGVIHLNEGHCAFAPLERLASRQRRGLPFSEALAAARQEAVFTTHTPVPAGHDRFAWEQVDEALGAYRREMGWSPGTIMGLGRVSPKDQDESLCMTVLALKTTRAANGVSQLHGEVSRQMWTALYPDRPVAEVPIGHITNGVHPLFWMHPRWQALFDTQTLDWRQPERLWDPETWRSLLTGLDDGQIWKTHQACRQELVDHLAWTVGHSRLDPHGLTLGFARRFAPYKRANLLFSQPERLATLVHTSPGLQLIFAGKAHPRDTEGQAIAAEVLRWTEDPRFRGKVVFCEDYDIHTGRLLTAGADVWLNNPRRPREASGTSGQKVPLNGGLNLSILDGWWPEAYDGTNGWAIGHEQTYSDPIIQDRDDAESLFSLLEQEVVPTFLDRVDGTPGRWVAMMRRAILTCVPHFNTHRMVRDYTEQVYFPATLPRSPG